MKGITLTAATASLILAYTDAVFASPTLRAQKKDAASVSKSYDYIVVGGGVAGLTVANRLSEKASVLIIEAGDLDQQEDYITIPGLAGTGLGSKYDWNSTYQPHAGVNGRSLPVSQGLGVGGGSLLNRMLMDRGSKGDYDRWEKLGNAGWNWDGLLPYFKKSEKYVPANADVAKEYNITYDPAFHGTDGPIRNSHSPYVWPSLKNYIFGHRELGAPTPKDGGSGDAVGVYAITHCQDPAKATRDSARTAYYDPVKSRKTVNLLTNTRVTKLTSSVKGGVANFEGVEIATSAKGARTTIKANKEVILAAGAFRTPQILQLSGVGDPALLKKFNIPVVANNVAVGRNLQDHALIATVFGLSNILTTGILASNATFRDAAMAEYKNKATGPYSTATADYLAFLNAGLITPDKVNSLAAAALLQDPTQYLDSDTPATVKAGYAIQKALIAAGYKDNKQGIIEVIWADGVVIPGLMHPLSRGSVKINSTDPFVDPLLDAGIMKNPIDRQMIAEAIKYVRRLMATKAMAPLSPMEFVPGTNTQSDADLDKFVQDNIATIWHPAGSCHMASQALGGCVDAKLQPYGTSKLRVVDASAHPMLVASHVMSTVYAVAEKAAAIIIADN